MDVLKNIERYAVDKEKIAQIYRNKTTTYKEFKEKSDALASYIIDEYKNDKTPILVYGHKQEEMLTCFFACTKAGHAYIPIDITFPQARVRDIIESSGAKLLMNVGNLKWESSTINVIDKEKINYIINREGESTISRKDAQKILNTPIVHSIPSDWKIATASLNKGVPIIKSVHLFYMLIKLY